MGPRELCLLCSYWERLKMVSRAGGYYRAPFYGERGITQGDPLLPTIFKVVVDTVVCHWESLVAEQEGGDSSGDKGDVVQTMGRKIQFQDDGRRQAEERHQRLTIKAELFYADNWMVAPTDSGRLQLAFDTLPGIFDRLGLRKNLRKTVGMVCRPCRAAGV